MLKISTKCGQQQLVEENEAWTLIFSLQKVENWRCQTRTTWRLVCEAFFAASKLSRVNVERTERKSSSLLCIFRLPSSTRKKTLTEWMSSSLIQSEISLFFKSCFALELCCAMPQREWSYFNWVCVPKKSRTLLYFSSCTHIVLSLCMLRVCGIMCLLWLEPNDEQFRNFSRSHIAVDILEKSFAESFE